MNTSLSDRIKLTEESLMVEIRKIHFQTKGLSEFFNALQNSDFFKQILDDHQKIDKITAFAKNLVYSNPHVSWQLKQLLRSAPPKTVTYKVSCSKCKFEQDHEDVSLEKIKQIHEDWNDNNKAKMTCLHDYQYKLVGKT